MADANSLTAHEVRKKLMSRLISVEDYVISCLARIDARESTVGAWQALAREQALKRARKLDTFPDARPLYGVPVAIKDVFDTHDLPTSYGSGIYSKNRPVRDAACVALIREAGGIPLGKTALNEFAYYTPGKTANPHNPKHTPGGSSSGSAAAVADFMVPLALGTQTAGSVIRPASYCGVVGYKPTFGLINRAGVLSFAETLDTVGVFGRSVSDAALITSVLARQPDLAVGSRMRSDRPRIGICRTHDWSKSSPEIRELIVKVASALSDRGAKVTEVMLPDSYVELHDAHATIMSFEAARSFSFERTVHREKISSRFLELLVKGERCSPSEYEWAMRRATECRRELPNLFQDVDVLVTPSVIGEAPLGLENTGDPVFNRIWTLLHTPCVHLPTGVGRNGLPLGIQLVADKGRDKSLLPIAEWFEDQLKPTSRPRTKDGEDSSHTDCGGRSQ